MHSSWRNCSDFMEDLWTMSEMEGIGRRSEIEEPPPSTILEYRARMAENNSGSIYDNPSEDGVTLIISGRGRGGISTILRPGVSRLSDDLIAGEDQRRLRQVSGLGYSNEMIQDAFRAMTQNSNRNSPHSPARTPRPETSSPLKTTSYITSPLEKERSSSSCSTLSSSSNVNGTEAAAAPPPPLSVMRKKAQEERAKNKEKAAKEATATVKDEPKAGWRSESSDEHLSWRRRDNKSPNRFFKLDDSEFPPLK